MRAYWGLPGKDVESKGESSKHHECFVQADVWYGRSDLGYHI